MDSQPTPRRQRRLDNFLRRPVCFLGKSGAFSQIAPGGAVPRAPIVLLSRGLCRPQKLAVPASLPRQQARAAAWIQAEAAAPFDGAAWTVLASGGAYAAWYWNPLEVKALLDGRARYDAESILPETIVHEPFDGWRQVASEEGIEAQIWRRGALVASVFQTQPMTEREWTYFIRAHSAAAGDPPPDPPSPTPRRFDFSAIERIDRIDPDRSWKLAARVAAALAALLLAGAVMRAGALAHHAAAGFIETQRISSLAGQGRTSGEEAEVRAALRGLRAIADASSPAVSV